VYIVVVFQKRGDSAGPRPGLELEPEHKHEQIRVSWISYLRAGGWGASRSIVQRNIVGRSRGCLEWFGQIWETRPVATCILDVVVVVPHETVRPLG